MEPIEIVVAIGTPIYAVYKLYRKVVKKKAYKNEKSIIYEMIDEGLKSLDPKLVNEGIKKLEEFDEKYFQSKCGMVLKFGKNAIPKLEKMAKKLDIPLDILQDVNKLKEHMEIKKIQEKRETKLKIIVEEEEKTNEALEDLKLHLKKLIRRNIAKQNEAGLVKDILVNTLNDYHKELEEMLEEKVFKKAEVKNAMLVGQKQENMKVIETLQNKQKILLKK